ncbi:MAG: dihydrofolate reductase family protein [Pseudomonadales bacterium]
MRVSVYIGISLDGYIARADGDIDWLMAADTSDGSDDYGYKAFSDSVDCMIMGRNTFEKVLSFPEWPYVGKRLIVLSRTLKALPVELEECVVLYSGSIIELVKQLENEGCQRLYIDGGETIQSFLNEGLITDLSITRVPVLLGEGLSLFGKTKQDIQLKHISTKTFKNGFVQSIYGVVNEV